MPLIHQKLSDFDLDIVLDMLLDRAQPMERDGKFYIQDGKYLIECNIDEVYKKAIIKNGDYN